MQRKPALVISGAATFFAKLFYMAAIILMTVELDDSTVSIDFA